MNPDLLQQLRDIHLPTAPGWWPPAIGWWLLAALLAAALVWLGIRLVRRWRRFRPARAAERLYRGIDEQLRAGAISPAEYAHRANELLKRFALYGARNQAMATESGDRWLRYLDERYGQMAFSRGAGRCLGGARFRPEFAIDTEALDGLLRRYLARERRRFWRPGNVEHFSD